MLELSIYMLRYRYKIIVLLAFFTTFTLAVVNLPTLPIESNSLVQKLGNPLLEDGHSDRALNVWDLQAFEGKIYLGGGSTVSNPGPINVWAYDPTNREFVKEYTVDEEAIEHYRVFDDRLYIPAADPTQGDRNKFYRKTNERWQKHASPVVKLAHVRDLIKTSDDDILMVGNNRQPEKQSSNGTALATATKDGLLFKSAGIDNVRSQGITLTDFNWFFSVFEYQKRIFATNSLLRDADNYPGVAAEYNPKSKQFVLDFDLHTDEFIPRNLIRRNKYGLEVVYRPWNPVEFQDYLIYPVRSYSVIADNYRQAYMNSIGFFYKSGIGDSPQKVKLPRKALGEDVLIIDNELYVLANRKMRDDKFIVYVYKTDRLDRKIKWQRVVKFNSVNKARSFEYLDGTFYFGLGQDYGEAIANAGDLLSYTPQ